MEMLLVDGGLGNWFPAEFPLEFLSALDTASGLILRSEAWKLSFRSESAREVEMRKTRHHGL